MAGTRTYLQLVNDAIKEAGTDLSSFLADGSDFTTNTNAMLQRFSGWTSRAWKSIQQECYDWEFMEETAVVNLDPGIMFYTDGTPVSIFSPTLAGATVNIFDQDGSTAISNVTLGSIYDLTSTATSASPFGYANFDTTSTTPLQFVLKPGAEYFAVPSTASTYTLSFSLGPHGSGGSGLPIAGATIGIAKVSYNPSNGQLSLLKDYGGIGTFVAAPAAGNVLTTPNLKLSTDWVAATNLLNTMFVLYDPTKSIQYVMQFVNFGTGTTWYYTLGNNTSLGSSFTSSSAAGAFSGKAFVHSWKSFNFDEESHIGEFQESIQEINSQSFKIIDYYAGAPAQELPLPFMPWESFRNAYSQPAAYPGVPRLITEDNTGRWQLYPQPQQRYTVKFDYIRRPQILTAFGDIPKGLNDDFMDVIMWQTLIYYGEYDEQPSVVIRATKHYRDLLSRLEQKNREKFHLKPKRLW